MKKNPSRRITQVFVGMLLGLCLAATETATAQEALYSITPTQVQTVPFVDVNRYLGSWYEIASNPQRFSRGCTCTRADYSLRSEGVLNVVNTCRDQSPSGRVRSVNGRAYIEDRQSNAKLSVGFFLPFLPWFRGEYWIIDLASDYSYAAVSNSEGSSLWILSRTPEMDEALFDEIVFRVSQKVDVSKLEIQRQSGCWN